MTFRRSRAWLFLCMAMMLTALASAANVVIVNNNAAGVGLNDATPASPVGGNAGTTLGAQRLIALQYAAGIWGAALDSNVEIRIQAQFTALSCTETTAVLGSAGTAGLFSDFANAEFPATWYHAALANKRAGTDLNTNANDINANFNLNIGTTGCFANASWYYGLDTNQSPSQVNLVAVALHEFAHGLGFSQFASTTTGAQNSGMTDVFGRRLFDRTQNKFWNEMTDAERVASAINTGNVVWTGPTVSAAAPNVLSGTPLLQISAPPAIAGSYAVGTAAFGAPISATPVSGQLLMATDAADGTGPATTDACTTITNGAQLAGKIAVVDRGTCTFVVKAKNVQNAGAIAMVVADNVAGSPPPGLGGADPTITIPSVRITQADGNAIKAQLAIPATVTGFLALNLNQLAGADNQGRLLMNAPNPVEPGSSISHWDPLTLRNQLMEPSINDDLTHSVTAPEDLTLALMLDLGWSTSAAPAASFSTTTLAFGNLLMGYGSFNRKVIVSNSGNAALIIASIGASGEAFSQSHDCPINPSSLQPAAACTVTVYYNPSSLFPQTGTLTITTNAPGSPHVVSLSGAGVADLTFSLSRPSRPLRVSSGGSSNGYELVITPAPGFAGQVALSCAGQDAGVSCTVQPGTVMVAGAPVSAALTVKVAGRSLRLRRLPTTETRVIKVNATVQGVTRSLELPVVVAR